MCCSGWISAFLSGAEDTGAFSGGVQNSGAGRSVYLSDKKSQGRCGLCGAWNGGCGIYPWESTYDESGSKGSKYLQNETADRLCAV